MDTKQLNAQLNQAFAKFNQQFNNFINFVSGRLKNFKNISLGEQIAYPTIGIGIILILTSIVMFII